MTGTPSSGSQIEEQLLRFGARSFRPLQRELIECALGGHSCAGIFPTGYGKSICYQIPAVLLGRVTIVVSPLIALMRDQVESLRRVGVACARYDSSLSDEEREMVLRDAGEGRIHLLYMAPEALSSHELRERLSQCSLGLLVIDEAHCVSEWGHSFRPDYLGLADLAASLPFHAVMALTATATDRVRRDLSHVFDIKTDHVFVLPPDRPNIRRSMVRLPACGRADQIADLLDSEDATPAIIYAGTRKTTEELAFALSQRGMACKAYHAGMPAEVRMAIQKEFQDGVLPILVATIAFGMGIDKADVRSVIHHQLPSSPESYIQESGRAGRDGEDARSVVLWDEHDLTMQESRIRSSVPDRDALALAIGRIVSRGVHPISLYSVMTECDLPEQGLGQLLFDLQREGVIAVKAQGWLYYKAVPLFPLETIVAGRDEREAQLLARLHDNREGEVADWAIAAGLDWDEALSFLEELIHSGEWKISFRQRALLVEARDADRGSLVDRYYEKFGRQMRHDLERLKLIMSMMMGEVCLNERINRYFGFDAQSPCGHCEWCHGINAEATGINEPESTPTDEDLIQIQALVGEKRRALSRPDQLTRFLLGHSSPASMRARLWSHPMYGMLSRCSWHEVHAVSVALLR